MKLFNNLNEEQKQELLKYPAYISLLAAFRNDKLDEGEKKISNQLRTFPNPFL